MESRFVCVLMVGLVGALVVARLRGEGRLPAWRGRRNEGTDEEG